MSRHQYMHTHHVRPPSAPCMAERVVHSPDGTVRGYVRKYRTVGDYVPFVWQALDEHHRPVMGGYEDTMDRAITCVTER